MTRSMAVIERELAALIYHSEVVHANARELATRAEVIRRKAPTGSRPDREGVGEDDNT